MAPDWRRKARRLCAASMQSCSVIFIVFAFFYWVVDVRGWRKVWTCPAVVLGKNALAYAIMIVKLNVTMVTLYRRRISLRV